MIADKRASPCSLRSFDGAVDVNEKGTHRQITPSRPGWMLTNQSMKLTHQD